MMTVYFQCLELVASRRDPPVFFFSVPFASSEERANSMNAPSRLVGILCIMVQAPQNLCNHVWV